MLLPKKQISIPIHDFLNTEFSSLDLDFKLIYKNQTYNFNSTYLASISQSIRDIFISDPLAFEYDIDIQIKNKMKDIITILSDMSFQVNNSNYADCFGLAIKLRSDQLFSFIWNQIKTKLNKKDILKYAVLAYNNRIEIPESLEICLAENFQDLFLSGLVTELSPDECMAITLTESDPKDDKEFYDRISTTAQQYDLKLPKYLGFDKSIGQTPPGLIYLIMKKYPTYILSFIRNVIINRYINQPESQKKNSYLIKFDTDVEKSGEYMIDAFASSNINSIRFVLNSMKSKVQFPSKSAYTSQVPFAVPCNKIFDYYSNYNGIIKTSLRPIIRAPKSLSPEYPIMNIFICDDTRSISNQNDSFVPRKTYISIEKENNFIEFDFSPYYIKLSSFVMIDPPISWELLALYPRKPDNYNYWFLIDKHYSNSISKSGNIVFKDIKNLDISCQKFKLQQPKDTSFRFSLNFIDFFGTIEKDTVD